MICEKEGCTRKPVHNEGKTCILHNQDPDKCAVQFSQGIDAVVKLALTTDSEVCNLRSITFPTKYDFSRLRYAANIVPIDLQSSVFYCDVTLPPFYKYKALYLNDCHFLGKVIFIASHIDYMTLSNSIIEKEVSLSRTRLDRIGCTFAVFKDEVLMGGTEFLGPVSFTGTIFHEHVYLKNARFTGTKTIDKGHVFDFSDTEFLNSLDLIEVHSSSYAVVHFNGVFYANPKRMRIHHTDLSRWSFIDTDVRDLDMENVKFNRVDRSVLERNMDVLFDELNMTKGIEATTLPKLERLYRQFRLNFESSRNFEQSSQFNFAELEVKRIRRRFIKQIPFWIFRFSSGYGERYLHAISVFAVLLILASLCMMFTGYRDESLSISVHRSLFNFDLAQLLPTVSDFTTSLFYAFQTMTLVLQPDLMFESITGKVLQLAISVIGALQLALMALAVNRQFRR